MGTKRLALLVVSRGDSFTVDLEDGEAVWVGRGPEAGLRLPDERLAPLHLSLRSDGEGVEVDARASGAQLNEVQFSGRARLRVGDLLTVGQSALTLQSATPPPPPAPPPLRDRRELAARLEEEVERALRAGRPLLFALVRSRSARGLSPEALLAWQREVGPRAVVGELGATAAQLLVAEPEAGEAERLLEAFPRAGRGEKPSVGHARLPEDGTDAGALLEVALARITGDEAQAEEQPLFEDPVMVRLVSVLDELAPLPRPLLLAGERGVGKELLAGLVHRRSVRSGPLVKVDAAAWPAQALEGELLGKGGALERAEKGTLLVTHGERLPEGLYGALVKASEPRGARKFPGRLVVTARALTDELRGREVRVPALRDRPGELLPLAEHFLSRCRRRHGRPRLVLGEEVRGLLKAAEWPGNLRQLRNALEAAVLVSESDELRPDDLPPEVRERAPFSPSGVEGAAAGQKDLRSSLDAVEKDVLLKALASTRWNVSRAAKELGLPRRTVVYRMARLGLRRPER